jgi:hypothetical protein
LKAKKVGDMLSEREFSVQRGERCRIIFLPGAILGLFLIYEIVITGFYSYVFCCFKLDSSGGREMAKVGVIVGLGLIDIATILDCPSLPVTVQQPDCPLRISIQIIIVVRYLFGNGTYREQPS